MSSVAQTLQTQLQKAKNVKIMRNGVPLSSRSLAEQRERLITQVVKKDVEVEVLETGRVCRYHVQIGLGSYTVVVS